MLCLVKQITFFIYFFSQVLEVIAAVKEQDTTKLAETYYDNTLNLFFNKSKK